MFPVNLWYCWILSKLPKIKGQIVSYLQCILLGFLILNKKDMIQLQSKSLTSKQLFTFSSHFDDYPKK